MKRSHIFARKELVTLMMLLFLKIAGCQANPTQSGVISSIPATLLPFTDLTIKVQARNAGGNPLTSGGDDFYILVKNHCTWSTIYDCTAASPASTALDNEISTKMTDKGDGTYEYTLRVNKEGIVTYKIILVETGKVLAEYYETNGSFLGRRNVSNIDFGYGGITLGSSLIWGSRYDYVMAEFKSLLKPPRTETYNFNLKKNDEGWINIDGVSKVSGNHESENFQMAMDSNNLYQVYVKWIEYISTAEIRLRWNETGSMNAVQPQYFVYY